MTVGEMIDLLPVNIVTVSDTEREVNGVYIGDLLSWVMGRANQNNIWITIMSNINVVAVASLVDTACVILAEGVTLDQNVVDAAKAKSINIVSTDLTAYEIAVKISEHL